MAENKNILAFPHSGWYESHNGMTLKDYFAAKAMIAFMSNEKWVNGLDAECARLKIKFRIALAKECYEMADMMLKAREK